MLFRSTLTLGSHGETMVPVPSRCTVNGKPLTELLDASKIDALVDPNIRDVIIEILRETTLNLDKHSSCRVLDVEIKSDGFEIEIQIKETFSPATNLYLELDESKKSNSMSRILRQVEFELNTRIENESIYKTYRIFSVKHGEKIIEEIGILRNSNFTFFTRSLVSIFAIEGWFVLLGLVWGKNFNWITAVSFLALSSLTFSLYLKPQLQSLMLYVSAITSTLVLPILAFHFPGCTNVDYLAWVANIWFAGTYQFAFKIKNKIGRAHV